LYFLIALGFSWAYVLVVQVFLGVPSNLWTGLPVILGPTLAAFIMTGVTEGKPGIRRFLQRFVLWRVKIIWYLLILVGVPIIFVLGTIVLPGALASFHALTVQAWRSYPGTFILVLLVGGPLLEEPGWRGFALSRLERKWGPLGGSLILGILWAAWHYPQYLLPTWAAQNGGLTLSGVTLFTCSVIPFTLIFTWVFNHTRGSLLMAILLHASIDTFSLYIGQLFPVQAESQLNGVIGFGITALVIVVLTRGRLGYAALQRDQPQQPDER
jgi:membrane protease YdiL (CAAX protease family)